MQFDLSTIIALAAAREFRWVDWQIMDAVHNGACATYADISRRTGISRHTVRNRAQRLYALLTPEP